MKKIAILLVILFVTGYNQISQAQNTEITVYATAHSCCPNSGYIDADREYQGDGIGELYTGPGTYTVYWSQPLTQYEKTDVVGETGNTYCVVHPGGPSVHMHCYGIESHYSGNSYPISLDFNLYLGVVETGLPGPPPPNE